MGTEKIDCPLVGMQTEEGRQRISKALNAKHRADYECYLVLRDIVEKGLLNKAVSRSAADAVVASNAANDELGRAVAGV